MFKRQMFLLKDLSSYLILIGYFSFNVNCTSASNVNVVIDTSDDLV